MLQAAGRQGRAGGLSCCHLQVQQGLQVQQNPPPPSKHTHLWPGSRRQHCWQLQSTPHSVHEEHTPDKLTLVQVACKQSDGRDRGRGRECKCEPTIEPVQPAQWQCTVLKQSRHLSARITGARQNPVLQRYSMLGTYCTVL